MFKPPWAQARGLSFQDGNPVHMGPSRPAGCIPWRVLDRYPIPDRVGGEPDAFLDPANDVTIADVRNAIRNQGFSPRDAEVRVAGRLEEKDGALVLRVAGSESPYPVAAEGEILGRLRSAIGEEVTLSADVPRTDEPEDHATIRVTAIEDP